MKRDWLPLLNDVREKSAAIIGAEAEECVIVPNTTHGVNTILHNIKWTAGDRIVICKSFPSSFTSNSHDKT
jgi:selenocysteine lyase/cysteine desulfurase